MMIDTHCHLFKEDYPDLDAVIKNMDGNIMIVSSAGPSDIDEVMDLIDKYDNIYGTIGIHPEYADTYTIDDLNKVEACLSHPKVVGVGEIGLDYHYTSLNKEAQKELFIKQIKLANKYGKTIVIHTRDAMRDTYDILKEYKDKDLKCNLHCYGGSLEMAYEFIKLNCTFGIGGVLTFKNEKKLKEIVKRLDISNFVLETDSPYLTPSPFRGKRNEPKNIYYVALCIADLKDMELDEVLAITSSTAMRQFDINI